MGQALRPKQRSDPPSTSFLKIYIRKYWPGKHPYFVLVECLAKTSRALILISAVIQYLA